MKVTKILLSPGRGVKVGQGCTIRMSSISAPLPGLIHSHRQAVTGPALFYAPAFALWRPLLEAMVRACVSLKGTQAEVVKIRRDRYKMDFEKAGGQVADSLGVEPALFRGLFKSAQRTLHSLTHSGVRQLHGRFDGNDVVASYPTEGIRALDAPACRTVYQLLGKAHPNRMLIGRWNFKIIGVVQKKQVNEIRYIVRPNIGHATRPGVRA